MSPIIANILILITGIIAGYFGAYYRSRRDVEIMRTQASTHFDLALRQHQMQLEATQQANLQARVEDAYDQLGAWLRNLERAIDEVWFGCTAQDDATRRRAQHLLDMWPWETLRTPAEARSAEFYWSSGVREEIRRFEGASVQFTTQAMVAISNTSTSMDSDDFAKSKSAVWNSRGELRAALDNIRDRVRTDLGLPADY